MVPEFVSDPVAAGVGGAERTNFGGGLGERKAKRSLPQTGSAMPTRKTEEFGNTK